ncbi:MAG: hypothetical protein H7338_06210 [Candidatus Sericytochromatia bacterium]|nr:hypothetical protein [Candidatus Sericytochromatia bacterium]
MGLAPGSAYDHSSAQQGGPGDIIMVGVPTLGPRYNRLQTAIDTGHLGILDGRLESISEIPGSRRLLLTIKPKDGGEAIQVEAGRVVLSTGARSAMGDVLKDILPADFNAATTTLKDAESPHVETIFAHDDAHGAPIEVADQLKAGETSQDIFFAGAAGRIKTRGKGYPFLKDFGNRNLILANKIVAGDAPVIGLKPQRRQIAVTPAMALKSPSTSVRGRILQGLGKAFGEQISVTPRSMAEGTIGMASIKSASMPANNTPLTIKVGLSEILHKRFTFPGLTRLDLTLTRNEGGSLVLRSPQLDQASLHALAAAIQSDQALSQHLGGFASMGRRQVEIKVDIGTDAVIKPGTMGLMY